MKESALGVTLTELHILLHVLFFSFTQIKSVKKLFMIPSVFSPAPTRSKRKGHTVGHIPVNSRHWLMERSFKMQHQSKELRGQNNGGPSDADPERC